MSPAQTQESQQKQDDIRKEIARLQAQLQANAPSSPKKITKQQLGNMLAPPTPSPTGTDSVPLRLPRPVAKTPIPSSSKTPTSLPPKPAPSAVLAKLAKSKPLSLDDDDGDVEPSRSAAFADKPAEVKPAAGTHRDERLALIEDFEPGPYDHKPPFDDPNFEQLEPNSGIRLSSRVLPHEHLQDHLTGRFYISPSRLYSCVRLLPDKRGYDVPVYGDWVTIAVVAERGPIKFSKAPVTIDADDEGRKTEARGKGKQKEQPTKPSGKKYVNMKLVDFGSRSRSASSATGGKAVIRGDAFLSLLLFESDGFDVETRENGSKGKIYKGGSRGAFESMSKLKEGDVIALMNPKILKPFQHATSTPHPTNNILALTPESAGTITAIGRAKDLGMCTVLKRDGSVCGSWCDKRVSDVCEWHVQNAVERRRAARPEFSASTSGMSNTTIKKRKLAYDPARQWGLKPADAEGSATYVVSGHVVKGSGPSSLEIAENIGREGQAKAQRLRAKDADKALKDLLDRDKEGMKAVVAAREFAQKGDKKGREDGRKRKRKDNEGGFNVEPSTKEGTPKSHYSAEMVKQLGFNPAARTGQPSDDSRLRQKLEVLTAMQSSKRNFNLAPRPGQRVRSNVTVPVGEKELPLTTDRAGNASAGDAMMVDLDD
ncbi:hypothetical protein IW261DRAFT_1646941 [Armillaria novae-zelandiae]|uniref:Zinc finger Mcm10/DnaG-type domain-containing protein n=1 Tax=Armillaria novae-zelandiae TaxID=153914 RepID=A0AA39P0G0_9AGAR|nr:hypothetical protein IW261DRAFT_1646941 [Armillaria novae-zelandiae]